MYTYEQGKKRLIDRVSGMNSEWSPTPLANEIRDVAKRLRDLVDDLDGNSIAWAYIEDAHDKPRPLLTGFDRPLKTKQDGSSSCAETPKHIRSFADFTDSASDILQNPHKQHPRLIGSDEHLKPEQDFSSSYAATLMHMRALADSANSAADRLPDSRTKRALPFAAMGLLHLKAWHTLKIGQIEIFSPAVVELGEVCNAAGIFLSEETFRNALRKEFNSFTLSGPHYFPPGIWEIVSGG